MTSITDITTRWAGRRAVATVVAIGVCLSIALAWTTDRRGRDQAAARLATEADRSVAAIETELRRHLEVARAAAAILDVEGPVDQQRWSQIAERLQVDRSFPALFAFNQTLAATPADVRELEARFGVELRPPDPALERDRYGVIVAVYPVAGNAPALGFDVRSNPVARATVDTVDQVGEAALSDGLRLVQETEDQIGVVAYQSFAGPDGGLHGWVNAVIRGQDFLDGVVGQSGPRGPVGLVVRDVTPDGVVEIGRMPAELDPEDTASAIAPVLREVSLAGQRWEVEAFAMPGMLTGSERHAPWAVVLVGLALTAIVSIQLRSAGFREARARELAAERTAELTVTNDRLLTTNLALERASRAKDDFLAVISHEFRTPLTVIRGFVTTLLEYRRADLDDTTADVLERIDANARRLDGLVDDLLLASKLDSETLAPEPRPVEVDGALATALEEIGAGRTIVVDAPPGLVALVDPEHLHRMVQNLVTNALKYGGDPIEIVARGHGDRVVVEVRDHGDGVPQDLVPRLFDRFAQAESGNSRTTRGVGLGLSIVRDLCRVNGAEIAYVPGGPGAVFRLVLRGAPGTAAEGELAEAGRGAQRS